MSNADDLHSQPPLSDDYYRLVCQRAGVALVSVDQDLNIQAWNNAAGRVFGASQAQMVGTSLLSVFPARDRPIAKELLVKAIGEHEVSQFEFSQRDETGRLRYFAVAVSPIVDDEGRTLGAATWVRDITRRTELLEELGQKNKMGALGEMSGAMAHHFNNILGGLVTGVDFALACGEPEVEHRMLEQTARSLTRATRLVENLLVFAEGDHARPDYGDLTEVFLQAIGIVEPELADAKVNLELDVRTVPVMAVPRQPVLTLVFNLVHNAVEAMPGGGTMRAELQPAGNGCVIRITDNGRGMTDEQASRAFEPFYTTKKITTEPGGRAMGFGLPVVHRIVEEFRGKITVGSEPGKGTTVEVWLPTVQPDPEAENTGL